MTYLRVAFISTVLFYVMLFVIPHNIIAVTVLWQIISFFGYIIIPITLAYSHNGLRNFVKNRCNSYKYPVFEVNV